jgi:hypothetical protein
MMKNSTPMMIIGPRFERSDDGDVSVDAMVFLSPEDLSRGAGRMTGQPECLFIRGKVQRCQFSIVTSFVSGWPGEPFCTPIGFELRHCITRGACCRAYVTGTHKA